MKKLLIAGAALVLFAGWGIAHYFSPSAAYRQGTEKALRDFSVVLASKEQAKIHDALDRLLTDSAKIRLDISFASLPANAAGHTIQVFGKADFIAFIGNTLYSLADYGYSPTLEQFSLRIDRKSAAVAFTSREWAKDLSAYGGAGVSLRFDSGTSCEGEVVFEGMSPRLNIAACTMLIHTSPARNSP